MGSFLFRSPEASISPLLFPSRWLLFLRYPHGPQGSHCYSHRIHVAGQKEGERQKAKTGPSQLSQQPYERALRDFCAHLIGQKLVPSHMAIHTWWHRCWEAWSLSTLGAVHLARGS